MHNSATLIGHLGADPEIRRLGNGNPVASLRLATSDRWKDKATGERKERTEWHSIVIFNENLCKIVEQYTKKGSRILVEGAIRTRKFVNNDGKDQYRTEIVLENFNGRVLLLDTAGGERLAQTPDSYGTTRGRDDPREGYGSRPAAAGGGRGVADLDDDIPF